MILGTRSIQEDCIMDGMELHQDNEFVSEKTWVQPSILLAVCDGMGGHEKGDEASRFVCRELKKISHDLITDAEKFKKILSNIQAAALEKLPENCGTTVAGIFASDQKLIAFNAGDSRIYKIESHGLKYISHDHSLVQEMVDKLLIPDSAAKDHPLRNLIEFGFGPIFSEAWTRQQLYIHEEDINNNDIYLICTDGLVEALKDAVIHETLTQTQDGMGPRLFELLKRKRLYDNTSFILVKIKIH